MLSAITFPALGIEIDPSPVAFTVAGKAIYWYGIIIACGFLLAYLLIVKLDSRLMQLGLGAIIGGGIGNMIDRISLGYVVDFLDARIINFPVFNVADCFVCIGAGLLMLSLLLDWRKEAKGDKRENDAADH